MKPYIMKKALLTSIAVVLFAFAGICSISIAVLPYDINYQGRIPNKYTQEQLQEMRSQEGENYQTSMINYLTKMSNKRKYAYLDIHVIGQVQIDAMGHEPRSASKIGAAILEVAKGLQHMGCSCQIGCMTKSKVSRRTFTNGDGNRLDRKCGKLRTGDRDGARRE